MNKKVLMIFGIILLVAAAAVILNRIKNNNYRANNAPVFSDIPSEYRKFYDESNKWLDQKLVEWKPKEYTPMKFNGHLLFASEEVIDTTGKAPDTASIDAGFLEIFEELDTDTISLFIYPDMYAKYSERYDNMINSIRASKKQLYVAYMVGGGNGFIKFKNFEEYRNTELNFTRDFISKYHPDYYVIVDEITTMERRTGLNVSDEEWGKLVLEVNDLVKNISPQTKTIATGHSQELGFLKALADNIPSLDMIGMNIWGIDQIDETTSIGKKFKDTIAYAQAKNKGVVFEQTWALLHDAPEAKKISTLDFMKEPDAKYIKVLAYYANMNKVDIYSPFYIGKFIEYSVDPTKFKASFDSRQRTPAFYAYKSVIEEFKSKGQSEKKSWIQEGAIYETHPYYYPNHSFKEITAAIPRIKELGVKTIYLMPIWERQMKRQDTILIYLINDYYKIDPAYGSSDDLRELIRTVHLNDMKILFDLVTCCTPPDSVIYSNNWTYSLSDAELAEKAEKMNWKLEYTTLEGRDFVFTGKHASPIEGGRDLYDFAGEITKDKIKVLSFPIANWGPAVDLGNTDVTKYFTQIAEYYTKEYDIDGWRIDAPSNNYNTEVFSGDHSSKKLLISVRSAVQRIKPTAEFISEPGLPKEVPVEALYAGLGQALPSFAEGRMTSQEFINILTESFAASGKKYAFLTESHDLPRINKIYPQLNKNLLVMISTLPGTPFIQTGQEIGETKDWFKTGNTKPQVDWTNENYELKNFYRKILTVRNSSAALKYGDIKNVWRSGDNVYAFSRTYENKTAVVIINFSGKEAGSVLSIPFSNDAKLTDELSGKTFIAGDPANFNISVPAFGSRILTIKK